MIRSENKQYDPVALLIGLAVVGFVAWLLMEAERAQEEERQRALNRARTPVLPPRVPGNYALPAHTNHHERFAFRSPGLNAYGEIENPERYR